MSADAHLSLSDICRELGLEIQFLAELSDVASSLYTTFDLPKRSGGIRTICVPKDKLKRVQRVILDGFLSKLEMPSHVHGCVKGRSIVTNAREHVNKPLVIKIDIANFFGSISFDTVLNIFKSRFNCDDHAAETMTRLTTYGNFLPQGAPTSPILANIAALELDGEIIAICRKNETSCKFSYTRYVDDITISGDRQLAFLLADFYRAVHRCGFRANPKKLRFSGPSVCQKVTGVVVNQKLNAPKKIIRKIRQQLYYCNKYTLEGHCQRKGLTPAVFLDRLYGIIGHVRMTRPEIADEFDLRLRRIFKKWKEASSTEEERKLLLLKNIIQTEAIATFTYEDLQRRAAPAELWVDPEGIMVVRAFQLAPEAGWRTFKVASITSLAPESG